MIDPQTDTLSSAAASSAAIGPRLALLTAMTLVGLSAGFFVAYISSVTQGLAEVSDLTYVETFQAINETIRNPLFGIIFLGSIPAMFVAIFTNWSTASPPRRILMAAALPLYLVVLVITGTGNVPLNNDLAEVVVTNPEAATQARSAFEHDWNRFNVARTIAVVASFISLVAAAILPDDRVREP